MPLLGGGTAASEEALKVLKRWTLCLVMGHKWTNVPYPRADGATFLKCSRCGHENHSGQSVRPTGAGM
jgi:hypothetical protein